MRIILILGLLSTFLYAQDFSKSFQQGISQGIQDGAALRQIRQNEENLQIERERLELEKQRLELEKERMELERQKLNNTNSRKSQHMNNSYKLNLDKNSTVPEADLIVPKPDKLEVNE